MADSTGEKKTKKPRRISNHRMTHAQSKEVQALYRQIVARVNTALTDLDNLTPATCASVAKIVNEDLRRMIGQIEDRTLMDPDTDTTVS